MRGALIALAAMLIAAAAHAQTEKITIKTGVLALEYQPVRPISRLNEQPENDGVAGAETGISDNNTTGRSWARPTSWPRRRSRPRTRPPRLTR